MLPPFTKTLNFSLCHLVQKFKKLCQYAILQNTVSENTGHRSVQQTFSQSISIWLYKYCPQSPLYYLDQENTILQDTIHRQGYFVVLSCTAQARNRYRNGIRVRPNEGHLKISVSFAINSLLLIVTHITHYFSTHESFQDERSDIHSYRTSWSPNGQCLLGIVLS